MTCHVHEFDAREGGSIRISLTYDAPTGAGKMTAHTDTYHGRFVKLVPNEKVVEVDKFETTDDCYLVKVRPGLLNLQTEDTFQTLATRDSFGSTVARLMSTHLLAG